MAVTRKPRRINLSSSIARRMFALGITQREMARRLWVVGSKTGHCDVCKALAFLEPGGLLDKMHAILDAEEKAMGTGPNGG